MEEPCETSKPKKKKAKKTVGQQIVEMAVGTMTLWRTPTGDRFATHEGRNYKIDAEKLTDGMRDLLQTMYYDKHGSCARISAVREANETLYALAGRGETHRVHLRVVRVAQTIFIDLGSPKWTCIEITEHGWRVIPHPAKVKFIRPQNVGQLPEPSNGGNLDDLRPLVNLSDEEFILWVGCLLDWLKGCGPYFGMALHGEQGSCKSTCMSVVRRLLDPVASHKSERSDIPRTSQDLAVLAASNFMMTFDNIAKITPQTSNDLCRLLTGGALSTRKLWTNGEIAMHCFERPVVMNGIPSSVSAGDLAERFVRFDLSPIKERITETAYWKKIDAVAPEVLGALCSALSLGLRSTMMVENVPRMADSYEWVSRCIEYFGWVKQWQAAYHEQADAQSEELLANNLVGSAIVKWLDGEDGNWGEWHQKGEVHIGSAELITTLQGVCQRDTHLRERVQHLPQKPKSLVNDIKAVAPLLRKAGIDYRSPTASKARAGEDRRRVNAFYRVGNTSPVSEPPSPAQGSSRVPPAGHSKEITSRPGGSQTVSPEARTAFGSDPLSRDLLTSQNGQNLA